MLREFREFALRGNLVEIAVGFVLGVAFQAVVSSFAEDVLMQAIAAVFGRPDFTALTWGPVRYGAFLTAVVNFLIVAWALFLFLRVVNRLQRRELPPDEAPPQPAEEILLLREIRDILVARG